MLETPAARHANRSSGLEIVGLEAHMNGVVNLEMVVCVDRIVLRDVERLAYSFVRVMANHLCDGKPPA